MKGQAGAGRAEGRQSRRGGEQDPSFGADKLLKEQQPLINKCWFALEQPSVALVVALLTHREGSPAQAPVTWHPH